MAEPVPTFEFGEKNVAQGRNSFIPTEAYAVFLNEYAANLTMENIRIFYLRAYDAKQKLKTTDVRSATLKFGTVKFLVKNNHHDRNANMEIDPHDLTLHRISGFMARYLKHLIDTDRLASAEIQKYIINPIAEALGITWDHGELIYLSFFPGTEMFLEEFKMLPLAIGIYRVQQKQMKAEFLKKHLRQQYGDMPASQWMALKKTEVQNALATVSKLPWTRAGLSAAARTFLAEFGITL
ncbi:nucleoprotein [Ananindeua virus]|uniref:Nucleoprotein n=1 Tax=Ananindeua virus TaxID=1927813 RepID=A0A1L5IT98_9VIRU|nr:nucleoprotein [Ananindeua virus]APM83097.1 structural nucleocapsid protein N [Ananindeua virus]AXY55024.1 nucleoprotein [Ananindeua virus]QLA46999.1 N [Ananindeua virus] [Ananindeua virus]